MKRFYSLCLMLLALVCTGLTASAENLLFEWDYPGSVIIRVGGYTEDKPALDIPANATSFDYEFTGSPRLYVLAAPGYKLDNVKAGSNTFTPSAWGGNSASMFCSSSNLKNWSNKAKINITKLERNDTFTFNLENGEGYVTAKFTETDYQLELKDGENAIPFNPEIDKTLQLTPTNGLSSLYSVTLNGAAVQSPYTLTGIGAGSEVVVRAFEGDGPDLSTLTLDFPEGFEDCINNVRNWSAGSWIEPVDGKLSVLSGSDIQLNFKEDYTFTKFVLNGEDITADYKAPTSTSKTSSIRFKVNGNSTLVAEGSVTVYPDVVFTVYIQNPEGVEVTPGTYGSATKADLSQGTAMTTTTELPAIEATGTEAITFSPENAKMYKIAASSKNPYLYFAPKDGWYIYTVQAKEGGTFAEISQATFSEYPQVYVVARKMDSPWSCNFNVNGTLGVKLMPNSTKTMMWGNPEAKYTLSEGEQAVQFVPGLDNPFTFRFLSLTSSQIVGVYLDGLMINADDNGHYLMDPYYPATAEAKVADLHSTATIYATGKTAGTSYTVSVATPDDVTASVAYSPVRRVVATDGLKDLKFLKGTEFAIKPSTADCYITLGDEIVHGFNADGVFVNGLNAEGEYVFSLTKKTSITVGGQKFADIAVSPEAGTLKSLGEIKVTVPMIGNGESMLYTSPENIAKITLTSKDGLVLHGSEIGEPAMNADETGFEFPITFESAASAAGEYTLEIPAGTFYEVAWDDTAEAFVGVAGGTVSQAFTAKYTVDPTYTAKIDTYTLIPASGSALKSIEKIYLNLTEYTVYDMVQLGHEYATITNGTKSYMCEIGYDWNNMDCRGFEISILDDNYDPQALSEAGTWTLSIEAGTFSFDGESSQAIEANYTIGASLPVYPLSPVPGTVTGNLSKLTITFPGATEVEYDESKVITLTGKDFSATAAAVGQKAKSAAEQLIQFATTPLVAGEYTVAIPAGAFTVDGEPSEAVTATFTYEPLWKLTPAPDATVESLDEITLEFPNAKQASFDGSRWSFILTNGGSYAATGFDCTEVEGASHPTFKLTLDGEAQRPPFGVLQFMIDEGTFTVDGEASPEIRCTYVLEGTISNNYEVTPNNGVITYNEWGAMFAVVFDEQSVVTRTSAFASKAKVTVNGKELTFDTDYMAMPEDNYLLMQVGNPEYLIDGAALRVVLEAGAFEVNGEPSPAIDESWVLQAPKGYTFTITPEDGDVVNNLKTIHVGFPEATTAELFNEYGIWLAQTTGYGYRETPTVILLSSADYPVFELSFDTPPTVAQEYTLTCRQGAFTLDGSQESPEIIATFKYDPTSGIYDVEFGGATCVTVVTLDGKVILDKAPAADLDTLPAGVYIINGVKTLKK